MMIESVEKTVPGLDTQRKEIAVFENIGIEDLHIILVIIIIIFFSFFGVGRIGKIAGELGRRYPLFP
jgi:hypothetical protein